MQWMAFTYYMSINAEIEKYWVSAKQFPQEAITVHDIDWRHKMFTTDAKNRVEKLSDNHFS